MTPGLTNRHLNRLVYLGDADFFGELVCAHLKMIGSLQVDQTTSCDNLISRLEKADILVIEDGLQDCSVFELLTVLRLRAPEIPVLVLTANFSSELRLKLLMSGASDVIARDEYTCEILENQVRHQINLLDIRAMAASFKRKSEGVSLASAAPVLDGVMIPYDHEQPLEVYTMGIIRHFLGKYENNVVLVARKLGVGKSTIYRYLKENKLTLSGDPSIASRRRVEAAGWDEELDAASSDGNAFMSPLPSVPASELLDLSYLQRISRDDRSFMVGMMNVFFRSMDGVQTRLTEHFTSSDREGLLRMLGSMKSPVESMGMHPLRRSIERVEKEISQGASPALIGRQLDELYNLLNRSMEALKIQRFEFGDSGYKSGPVL